MTDAATPPAVAVPADTFYGADPRRGDSKVLSYGSGWRQPGWSDDTHVVQVYWLRATHELVVFYVAYNWDLLSEEAVAESAPASFTGMLNSSFGSGEELGRVLGDLDTATTATWVEVLGRLRSDLECHEVMWNWLWLQHHPDGLAELRQRVAGRARAGDPT